MATIGSANSSSYENTSRRSYITTTTFNGDFWSYTTYVNPTTYVTTGNLGTVIGADATNCPYGRVLRETGRKLVPGANPGVTVYMVEVFDNVTFLRGYINPNSPVYSPFNSDKPAFMEEPYVLNQDVSGGTYGTPGNFAGTQNFGPSIVTHGNALIDGYVETGGQIRCLQQIPLGTDTDINVALGQVFTRSHTTNTTATITASNINVGDRVTYIATITQTLGNTTTIYFGSSIYDAGYIQLGSAVATGTYIYTISFIGANDNGTVRLYETSRSGPLTA